MNETLFPIIKRGKKTESEFFNALKNYKFKVNGEYFVSEKLCKQRREELIADYDHQRFLEEEVTANEMKGQVNDPDVLNLSSDDVIIPYPDIESEINKDIYPELPSEPIADNTKYYEGYFKRSHQKPNVFISSDLVINNIRYIVICNYMTEKGFYECQIKPMTKKDKDGNVAKGFIVINGTFKRNCVKEKIARKKFYSNPANRSFIAKSRAQNK